MLISGIVDILQQQLKLYERILECEKGKKDLIMKNDVVRLNVLTQKEKLITAQADELETKRLLATAKYFKEIGFRNRSGILSDLIKSVNNPEEKQLLMGLSVKLSELLKELKAYNDTNQQLIQQSLDYINFSISLMVEDPSEDVTYQHPMNQLGVNKQKTWFDSKA